jgi:hypothetical protein
VIPWARSRSRFAIAAGGDDAFSPPARLGGVEREAREVADRADLAGAPVASTAWAASSTIATSRPFTTASMASMSHGPPAKCTDDRARARRDRRLDVLRIDVQGARVDVGEAGVAPACRIAFTVAGQ